MVTQLVVVRNGQRTLVAHDPTRAEPGAEDGQVHPLGRPRMGEKIPARELEQCAPLHTASLKSGWRKAGRTPSVQTLPKGPFSSSQSPLCLKKCCQQFL